MRNADKLTRRFRSATQFEIRHRKFLRHVFGQLTFGIVATKILEY